MGLIQVYVGGKEMGGPLEDTICIEHGNNTIEIEDIEDAYILVSDLQRAIREVERKKK